MIDAESIREFAGRPWGELQRAKRAHWARLHARLGPAATLAASRALWEHVRAVRPEWPTAADRAADLAHHVVLHDALTRIPCGRRAR